VCKYTTCFPFIQVLKNEFVEQQAQNGRKKLYASALGTLSEFSLQSLLCFSSSVLQKDFLLKEGMFECQDVKVSFAWVETKKHLHGLPMQMFLVGYLDEETYRCAVGRFERLNYFSVFLPESFSLIRAFLPVRLRR